MQVSGFTRISLLNYGLSLSSTPHLQPCAHTKVGLFERTLEECDSIRAVAKLLSDACEFDELPVLKGL